jgi:hypothetical protein
MTRTRVRIGCLSVCFVTAVPFQLAGQGPTVAAAQLGATPCTVQSCALEIRRGFFFNVIARADDSPPARIGLTGASVVRAVSGVSDAELDAREGRRHLLRSNWFGLGAVAVLSAGLISIASSTDDTGVLWGLASLPLGAAGGWQMNVERKKSVVSFDRAVWLYNRSLRPPGPRPRP